MGRWLSGTHEGLATFGDILHPNVREQLEKDPNWGSLLRSRRLITPAVHAAISQALGHFALRLVPYIVEGRYPGRLLYAGGDDVLALLPLEDALAVARELRAAFSGHIRFENGGLQVCLGEPVTGYVEGEQEIFLTMGPKATASIGLVFAHHLQPLDLVLRAVRRAEQAAKRRYGRNALAVEVLKRSGETLTVGTKWSYDTVRARCRNLDQVQDPGPGTKWSYDTVRDTGELLMDLIRRLEQEQISGKWPYAVQAESPALEALPMEAQKAELKRLLMRHTGQKLSKDEEEQAENLPKKLVDWAQAMGQLRPNPCQLDEEPPTDFWEMSRWLLVCSFIARGGEV